MTNLDGSNGRVKRKWGPEGLTLQNDRQERMSLERIRGKETLDRR